MSKVIFLISTTHETDAAGDSIYTETKRKIFADIKSIGQSEFYQAMGTGLKPEVKIEINRFEYKGERKAELDETVYDVIRTYAKDDVILEIVLGGGIIGETTK